MTGKRDDFVDDSGIIWQLYADSVWRPRPGTGARNWNQDAPPSWKKVIECVTPAVGQVWTSVLVSVSSYPGAAGYGEIELLEDKGEYFRGAWVDGSECVVDKCSFAQRVCVSKGDDK